MVADNDRPDTNPQSTESLAVQPLIMWRHLFVAILLGVLSLVDKWKVGEDLTITGGPTLIALAAVVLLWPVVRQITISGGEIDLKNLRLKVDALKIESQRIETDSETKIMELEAELSNLREQAPPHAQGDAHLSAEGRPTIGSDVSVIKWAVENYRSTAPIGDYRKRIEIDKEIIRRRRHISINALLGVLDSESGSTEVQMAIAVALGLPHRENEEHDRARLLATLLNSNSERVRARAGQAAKRWGERRTTSKESRSMLLSAAVNRLFEESPTSGARAFIEKAQEVLLATRDWGDADHLV